MDRASTPEDLAYRIEEAGRSARTLGCLMREEGVDSSELALLVILLGQHLARLSRAVRDIANPA